MSVSSCYRAGQPCSIRISFSREVAPRNKASREGAEPSALASRTRTAALAAPSCGLARTLMMTRSPSISTPSVRAPGVTRTASRPSESASARIAAAGGSSGLGFATQRRQMPPRQLAIARGLEPDLIDLSLILGSEELGWAPDPDLAWRNALAGAEQGARREHRPFADPAIVHRYRSHAHESAVFQGGAMHHGHVPDHAILADDGRGAVGIGTRAFDMKDAAILDVGTGTDLDPVNVAAQDAVVPDARFGPDRHVPDDPRARRDEGGLVDLRMLALERQNRCARIVHVVILKTGCSSEYAAGWRHSRPATEIEWRAADRASRTRR